MNNRSHSLPRGFAALLATLSLSSVLLAQMDPTPTPTPTATDTPTSSAAHSDKAFLRKAAKAGGKEIAISQAVMDRLSDANLKSFAQQMITDHTAANNVLMALAQQKGIEIPAKDDSSLSEEWSKKTGNIDREYVKVMVADHEEAVKLFEKATKSADADIAAFAEKTLPTLEHHLMMAQDLAKTAN